MASYLSSPLIFNNECNFEHIVSQLQLQTPDILCVENGSVFRVYPSLELIPKTLMSEDMFKNSELGTVEYRYRCKDTQDLYTFFLSNVDKYLLSLEERRSIGQKINSKKTQNKDKLMVVIPK